MNGFFTNFTRNPLSLNMSEKTSFAIPAFYFLLPEVRVNELIDCTTCFLTVSFLVR